MIEPRNNTLLSHLMVLPLNMPTGSRLIGAQVEVGSSSYNPVTLYGWKELTGTGVILQVKAKGCPVAIRSLFGEISKGLKTSGRVQVYITWEERAKRHPLDCHGNCADCEHGGGTVSRVLHKWGMALDRNNLLDNKGLAWTIAEELYRQICPEAKAYGLMFPVCCAQWPVNHASLR
ncbi:MAG: hypothetical protein V1826_00345 [bacterium]